jgi:gentisate 1,2-dioxygenase
VPLKSRLQSGNRESTQHARRAECELLTPAEPRKDEQEKYMSKQPSPAAAKEWTADAQYFEYSKAANPVGAGLIPKVPLGDFPSRLHEQGATRIIPFDLSADLKCSAPASNPSLCANFIRLCEGEEIAADPNATSQLYHVIRGDGETRFEGAVLAWKKGDTFALPAGGAATHRAHGDAAFYWVHDEPLLRYLGVTATEPRFQPTLYQYERERQELQQVEQSPEASQKNRVSVLLANKKFDQTRTITHVLWAMFGVLPSNTVQLPHRHESIALDFIIDCQPGCYTLLGDEIDDDGNIKRAKRADWKSGSAFVTPPGLWHSHHNESSADAYLLPVQDAGLHTYLRTLNIQFFHPEHKSYISQ